MFAAHSPWRSALVPRPPDESTACHHAHLDDAPAAAPPPATPARAAASDPLFAPPEPVPRTLSAEHWRRLDDGLLLARQPRVDWASLLRRTFLQDVLCCPRCRGRMAVIEPVTDPDAIRRSLAELGLSAEPGAFAPARDPDEPCTRGPPPAEPPATDGADPPFPDDVGDPPWQDDIPAFPDDEASDAPPDAEN